jgi:hypothetical protein
MPKKNVDYSKTVIYKFVCKDLNVKDCYVGHTTNFTKRKTQHKTFCMNEHFKQGNLKLYQTIRNNGGWDNWTMIEIEKYPCNDSNEATARERYHMETIKSNLNINIPNRSQKEYRINNVNNYLEKKKEFMKEYIKIDYNCCCGSVCKLNLKARHLQSKKHLKYESNNKTDNKGIQT